MCGDATPGTSLTLTEYWCEWCGADIKYVRVLKDLNDMKRYTWEPIDAVASVAEDPDATLIRVPASRTGHHNYAIACPEDWRFLDQFRELLYCNHKRTCPQRHQWTGKKQTANYRAMTDEERAWKNGNPELLESRTPRPDSFW